MSTGPWRTARNYAAIEISLDEDWDEPLPQMKYAGTGEIINLNTRILRMIIRPTFNYPTAFANINIGNGIYVDDAALGLASIFMSKDLCVSLFPIGVWQQFLLMEWVIGVTLHRHELWRGPFTVKPGRTS